MLQSPSKRERATYVPPKAQGRSEQDATHGEAGEDEESYSVATDGAATEDPSTGSNPLSRALSTRAPKDIHQELIFRALDETGYVVESVYFRILFLM